MDKLGISVNVSYNMQVANLQKQLEYISKNSNIKFKFNFDNKNFEGILDKVSQKYEQIGDDAKELIQRTSEYRDELGRTLKVIDDIDTSTGKTKKTIGVLTDNYKKQTEQYQKLVDLQKTSDAKSKVQAIIEERQQMELLHSEAIKLNAEYDKNVNIQNTFNAKARVQSLIEERQQMELIHGEALNINADIDKKNALELKANEQLAHQLQLYKEESVRKVESLKSGSLKDLYNSDDLIKYTQNVQELNASDSDLIKKQQLLDSQFKNIKNSAQNSSKALNVTNDKAQSLTTTFAKAASKFSLWIGVTSLFFGTVRAIQSGISSIVELDSAITNLKKVSDELGESVGIKQFTLDMNKMAISVGHSTTAAIDAVTEFKKLGYSLSESTELAKNALVYSNIGDIDIGDATKSITSTLAGFNLTAKDTIKIIDAVNEVGNNFSITSGGIGNALQRSSSALFEANNSLEESIGLIVAANASIQNPEKVGNALKTVSMRIRGINDETGEAIPKLDGLVESLTGVKLLEDGGTFKSTYQIMKEISKVWNTLKDTDQANLLESLFGKLQGSTGASLLNNMAMGIAATETAINSAGSSAKEQAAYMESIGARINTFAETVKKMWINTINTDFAKFVIDMSTGLVSLIDKIGLFNIALSGIILSLGIFNKTTNQILMKGISSLIISFRGLNMAASASAVSIAGTTVSIQALTSTVTLGLSVAIPLLITLFTKMANAVEDQKLKVEGLTSTIATLSSELDTLNSKKSTSQADELKIKNLERQIKLQQDLLTLEQDKLKEKEFNSLDKSIGLVEQRIKKITELANSKITSEVDGSGFAEMANDMAGTSRAIEDLSEDLFNLESDFLKNKEALEAFRDSTGHLTTKGKELEAKLKDDEVAIKALYDLLGKSQDFEVFINSINDAETSAKNLEKATDEYNLAMDSLQVSASSLSAIQNDLINGNKIEESTIIDLIQKYPQYASELNKLNDGKEAGISLTESLFTIEKEVALQKANEILTSAKVATANLQEAQSVKALFDAKFELTKLKKKDDGFYGFGTNPSDMAYSAKQEAEKAVRDAQSAVDNLNKMKLSDFSSSGYSATNLPSSSSSASKEAQNFKKELDLQNNSIIALTESLDDLKRAYDKLDEDSTERNNNLIKQQGLYHNLANTVRSDITSSFKKLQSMGLKKSMSDIFAIDANGVSGWKNMKSLLDWVNNQIVYYNNLNTEYGQNQIDVLEKVKDSIIDNIDTVQDYKDAYSDLTKEIIDNTEKQNETIANGLEESIEKALGAEIEYLEKQKKSIEATYDEKISKIEEEINLQKEKDDLEERELTRQEKLLAIEEAKLRLKNVENERNTRIINTDGVWEWVANPQEVLSAQEEIKNLEKDYSDWELENKRADRIKSLEEQKEYLEKEKEQELLAKDNLIAKINEKMETLADIESDSYAERINKLNEFIADYNKSLASLNQTSGVSLTSVAPIGSSSDSSKQKTRTSAYGSASDSRARLASSGYSDGASDISSYDSAGAKKWYDTYVKDRSDLSDNVKKDFENIVKQKEKYESTYHSGGFVGGQSLDPKHEEIAKLLKGEFVLSPPMLDTLSNKFSNLFTTPKLLTTNPSLSSANGITIENVNLPNVSDFNGFIRDARQYVKNGLTKTN